MNNWAYHGRRVFAPYTEKEPSAWGRLHLVLGLSLARDNGRIIVAFTRDSVQATPSETRGSNCQLLFPETPRQRIVDITCEAMCAVFVLVSYCGANFTTSPPTNLIPFSSRKSRRTSTDVSQPTSGVPGANPDPHCLCRMTGRSAYRRRSDWLS